MLGTPKNAISQKPATLGQWLKLCWAMLFLVAVDLILVASADGAFMGGWVSWCAWTALLLSTLVFLARRAVLLRQQRADHWGRWDRLASASVQVTCLLTFVTLYLAVLLRSLG